MSQKKSGKQCTIWQKEKWLHLAQILTHLLWVQNFNDLCDGPRIKCWDNATARRQKLQLECLKEQKDSSEKQHSVPCQWCQQIQSKTCRQWLNNQTCLLLPPIYFPDSNKFIVHQVSPCVIYKTPLLGFSPWKLETCHSPPSSNRNLSLPLLKS